MDKWKDIELEKMKVGGNRAAREFFDTQDDWDETKSIQQRYDSKAAALYRDKISCMAQGKPWDEKKSSAQNHVRGLSSSANYESSSSSAYQSGGNNYQTGGDAGYQNFNTPEFKDQKENFFAKKQMENATRRE